MTNFDKGYTDAVNGNRKKSTDKEYLDGYLSGVDELSKVEAENNY